MAGYKDRTVTLTFDEDEDGGSIYVVLRNPRKVPVATLKPRPVARDASGEAIDPDDEQDAVFETYAKLIVDWRVYDASVEGDQQLLELPATSKLVAKLPLDIQEAISEEVGRRRNPTPTPTTGNS